MKKIGFVLALLMVMCCGAAQSQNWTIETARDYANCKYAALVIDMTDCMVMDLNINDYPAYYSGKYSTSEKYPLLILDRFRHKFENAYFASMKKIKTPIDKAKYVVHFKFKTITEKGGFSGVVYVMNGKSQSKVNGFSYPSRGGHKFEKKLMKNADKFWNTVKIYSYYNPLVDYKLLCY